MKIKLLIISILVSSNIVLSQNIDDKCYRAYLAYENKEYAEAADLFSDIIQTKKSNEFIKLKALANYEVGNYTKALDGFNFLMKREKEFASFHIAKVYARLNDTENAIKYLKIHLQSNDKQTQASIKLEKAFVELKKTKQWEILWKNDWYSEYENQIGEAIYEMNHQNYIEAIDVLDQSILSNPKAHKALYLRAKAFFLIEDNKTAFKNIKAAKALAKNNEYIELYEEIASKLRKYDLALENINLLLKHNKYKLEYYTQRAKIYSALKKYELAVEDIQTCLKYDAENPYLKYLLAKYQTQNGDTWDALISINKLIAKDPKPEYLVARGQLFLVTNNDKSAFKDFSQALDYNPSIGEAYYELARLSLKAKDKKTACFYLKKAISLKVYEAYELAEKNCQE